MIKNLFEAMNYFKGTNVTVVGALPNAKNIRVNGKKVSLPMSCEELNKVVGA